ncbi:hypothetical protein FA95DRAFT_1504938 [Auriscalpium vulgare]|uniref:Uncharacterized protein n=1 Tax=Auriscalpium vulgare TaxID=40419 RepID=A0ACB8R491_9AGAM|nr:hypothetical protein FA95DRAFT_1504938 [Auriscalpium vulgare]
MTIGEGDDKFTYRLKGIVYHGDAHFTVRLVTDNGTLWYHDGISTGKSCIEDGKISAINDIYSCRGRKASVLIYSNIY